MTMKNHVTEDGTEIITPSRELLDIPIGLENLECPVNGCGRVVSNSSALRMHLLKAHGVGELQENTQKKKLFACPVQGCPRNVESPRKKFFKVMYLLKRHYQLVHAEKKYPCEKCGKKFGTSLATIKHEESCRRYFYCTCGAYYTAKNGLRIHLQKFKTHKAVPDPDEVEEEKKRKEAKNVALNEEQMQTVTVPCFLYIPKDNSSNLQNKQQQSTLPTQSPSPILQSNPRYIRILPKKKNSATDKPVQTSEQNQLTKYCNALSSGGLIGNLSKLTNVGSQQNSLVNIQGDKNTSLCGAEISSPSKNIPYVNPGKACRTILPKIAHRITNPQNLISNFTQTTNTLFPITQQVDTAIQTCGGNYGYSTVEVLETSDFSSQCQPNDLQSVLNGQELPVDNQTQTDEFDEWLANLQNNTSSIDMETQTNLINPSNSDTGLDKPIQLDDILSGKTWDTESNSIYISSNTDKHIPALFMSNKNMEFKQTISTQTFDDIQFEVVSSSSQRSKIDDKDIILPSEYCVDEPLSMSFGTQTGFEDPNLNVGGDLNSANQEMLSFGTQTGLESNFLSSSSTQTWDVEETSINAKNIETQTAISFSDLLDSSFIDEYFNTDRIMSTQTQTYQDDLDYTKTFANIETQTR